MYVFASFLFTVHKSNCAHQLWHWNKSLLFPNNQSPLKGSSIKQKAQFQNPIPKGELTSSAPQTREVERSSLLQRLQYSSDSAQGERHPSPVTVKGVELASSAQALGELCRHGSISPSKTVFWLTFKQKGTNSLSFLGSRLVQETKLAQLGKNSTFTEDLTREVTMWDFVLFRGSHLSKLMSMRQLYLELSEGTNFCYLSRDIISSSVGSSS